MDDTRLLEKLRAVEALFAGATTAGERVAADEARKRIQSRLKEMEATDPPVEYKFRVVDGWAARLFAALCRRYDIHLYRYKGQRSTTLMAKVSRRFVEETLWPQYEQLSALLRQHLDEVTERIIAQAIHADTSEAGGADAPGAEPIQLELGTGR